ncbi:MAG: L,D-transpeptidase, partial [Burkholderiales bacterium]|nr:L,D-transpeptidase [Anaerolineae bacterium]
MYRIVQHLTKVAVVLCGLLLVVMPVAAQDAVPTLTYNPSVCYAHTDGSPLSPECLAMIEAYPRPPVTDVRQDAATIDNLSFWRVGPDAVNTYDTPSGGVSGQIPAGFNFITAVDLSVDGWLQIQGGRWIQRDIARWTAPSFFTGAEISDGLEYPFAWVLDLSRIFVSAYPGGPRDQANERWIDRYERVNIFSVATDADGWHWYMIGPNQWVEQRFVARAHRIERPEGIAEGAKWVAVDLYEQTLVAYEGDTPVFATLVSTGLPPYETNEGLFNVWARIPADRMAGATGLPAAYD